MPIPAKTPQNSSSMGGAADHYPYPSRSLQKPSMNSKDQYGTHHVAVSPEESSNSWETRAYAEDASTLTVGIWPSRAYPCGFCHREFRSAQALGGHMNVHRRERARLRQSSPPAPFHATLNTPLQTSTNNMRKPSQLESSSTCVSPSVKNPKGFPTEPLSIKASTLPPTTLSSLSAISCQSSSAALAARYPSDMATSFALRLQLLASETASALLLPPAESLDLLLRWPSSALASRNGCCSTNGAAGIQCNNAIGMSAWSALGSCSSSTSMVASRDISGLDNTEPSTQESRPHRLVSCHGAPNLQPEDESPKKKSNFTNSPNIQMYQNTNLTNSPMNDRTNHAKEIRYAYNSIKVNESACCDHVLQSTSNAWSDQCVDLELRLGQRPPLTRSMRPLQLCHNQEVKLPSFTVQNKETRDASKIIS